MPAPLQLHFVVAGCGPAGLCAALALEQAGHVVTVLEARDQLTMLGAGLTVQPSATKALQRFGLGDWLEKRGVRNERILFLRCRSPNCLKLLLFNLPFVQKDDDGKILGSDTTGNEKHEFGTPSYAIHVRRNFYLFF